MNISKYSDIELRLCEYQDISNLDPIDTDIKYDWFDYHMISGNSADIYKIIDKAIAVGYISIYNLDKQNKSACVYTKIAENKYFGDLLKATLSVMDYGFTALGLNKINLIYREDNYFFNDVCSSLKFVKEAILRNQFLAEEKFVNLISYGMVAHEYKRLSRSDLRRMFTWDYSYSTTDVVHVNIDNLLTHRTFTNSLDNPNNARVNESLREFTMNCEINSDNYLVYKDIRFPVKIFDTEQEYDAFACQNQEIEVPEGQYSDILLVATALYGCQEAYLNLTYTDGTHEEVKFTVSDWCQRIVRDEYVIHYASACKNIGWGANVVKSDSFVYLKRISIDGSKRLGSIEISGNGCIYVYAVALCNT